MWTRREYSRLGGRGLSLALGQTSGHSVWQARSAAGRLRANDLPTPGVAVPAGRAPPGNRSESFGAAGGRARPGRMCLF